MTNTNETIADIIAEMRNDAERTEHMAGDGVQEILVDLPSLCREFADRLEAAWKREKATTEKSSAVGDAAKLREALECAKKKALYIAKNYKTPNSLTGNILELLAYLNAALAAPPRNCDVGTADEQAERFADFARLRFQSEVVGLVMNWAQMPYEEGEKE